MAKLQIVKNKDQENEIEDIVPFRPGTPVAGFHGEFNASDKGRLAYFSLIQSVGPNSVKFPENMGGLVYGGEHIIPKPIGFCFYGLDKYYRQNTSFDPETRPLIFPTAEEVLKNGGNLRERVKPGMDEHNYVAEATAIIVFESAKKADFFKEIDQKILFENVWLLPALWTLRGTKYTRVVGLLMSLKSIITAEKKELAHFRFNLDSKREKVGANWIWSPVIEKDKQVPRNTDAYVAKLHEIFEG